MQLEQTTLPDAAQTVEPAEPASRRDMLAEALTAAEAPVDQKETRTAEQRARDEAGRFSAKGPAEPAATPTPSPTSEPVAEAAPKLTTWKKEYLPLHDKLARGEALSPDEAKRLAAYNAQRESEYSTGVSVFKDRAVRLESLEKSIAPFMPNLQRHNIDPAKWLNDLGTAHETLALGSPQQKLQMFQRLAETYGIPLGAVQKQQEGQPDPVYLELMQRIDQLNGRVQDVTGWKEQQDSQRVSQAIGEIANDAEKFPHFEKVRGTMAQLLESGLAPDLKTAYAKAVRMDDEVWTQEQARQSQAAQSQVSTRQVVAKAKAAAVSPRSATPSGATSSSTAKDRRTLIAEGLDAASGRV